MRVRIDEVSACAVLNIARSSSRDPYALQIFSTLRIRKNGVCNTSMGFVHVRLSLPIQVRASTCKRLLFYDFLCFFRAVATGVGVVYLLKTVCSTLCFLCPFIKAYVLAPLGIFRPNLKKYGPWAGKNLLITPQILTCSKIFISCDWCFRGNWKSLCDSG